jgi:hypothetical protein
MRANCSDAVLLQGYEICSGLPEMDPDPDTADGCFVFIKNNREDRRDEKKKFDDSSYVHILPGRDICCTDDRNGGGDRARDGGRHRRGG